LANAGRNTILRRMIRAINVLPRIVDAPNGKPVRPEAPDNQQLMAEVLSDPSSWTPELARFTADVFDAMAGTWVDERGSYRVAPLVDALQRGGARGTGRCLEIGSGTGVLTASLQEVWNEIICIDLSMKMMLRHRARRQIQADASSLPFRDGAFNAIVIGDAPLFAEEVVRLLAPEGALIWSNALGQGAPYYLPTADMWDALAAAAPGSRWSAVESEALWGSWAVFHRSEVIAK
jgi:SAM-dependent methyltransferase